MNIYREALVKAILLGVLLSQLVLAEAIQDNSFLVEEAYNQEPGVVQFINVYQKNKETKDWTYTFINEIPMGLQDHQFSYELPFVHTESPDQTDVADIKVNYRYEFFRGDKIVTTGRFSLTTPTGKYDKGMGTGQVGSEISLISSIIISDKWVQHWNLGASFVPKAKIAGDRSADNSRFFFANSNVYLFSDNLNFMLEAVASSSEKTVADKTTEWSPSVILSPSLRYAIDYNDWQFVPGFAVPTGVGPSAGEVQYLVYLSIEGKLF